MSHVIVRNIGKDLPQILGKATEIKEYCYIKLVNKSSMCSVWIYIKKKK